MNSLEIYHTENKQMIDPHWVKQHNYVLWETCIRQVLIGKNQLAVKPQGFTHLSSIKAYRFLLEVICGLHSPMLGETEINAQFKSLIDKENHHIKYSTIHYDFWNNLQKDAKYIRTKYLKNYGQQSYGGIVHKLATSVDSLTIIGSGDLASSILTYFSKDSRKISLQCRNLLKGEKLKAKFSQLFKVQPLGSLIDEKNTMLVIAAPISTQWLEEYTKKNPHISYLIDLRSKQDHEKFSRELIKNYIDLEDVFHQVSIGVKQIKKSAEKAKIEIAKRSLLWQCKSQHRPFGWEEICVS